MGNSYLNTILSSFSNLLHGMRITLRHIRHAGHSTARTGIQSPGYFDRQDGLMTVQYPKESIPIPDTGRYRLHNEIDDCIVCDKCAKICPVDCIEIDAIRAPEVYGHTSDGTPKRIHAARFDIDMGKCCFCGLCTTVCPTECLTMTKAFDFSEFDVADHVYSFADMLEEEITEKRNAEEAMIRAKASAKEEAGKTAPPSGKPKPKFRPVIKKNKDDQ